MSDITVRPLQEDDMDAVLDLALLAWAPVFESFRRELGPHVYARLYPDWRPAQRQVVETICRDPSTTALVAERGQAIAGFAVYSLDEATLEGEVQLLAVHPAHQRRGIGTMLADLAAQQMQQRGMTLAVIGTGGDPGHAPARAAYEKAGFTPLRLVRYYKVLQPAPRPEAPDLRAQLRAFALTFPEAYEEYPWGQVVVKVRKKVFLFLDGDPADPALRMSVKLPISGDDVLALPFARPTGYGLGKAGWVSLEIEPGELTSTALLEPWVAESYRAVAPKRLVAQLTHDAEQ